MKHHPAVRALHWLMAVLVAGVFFVILRREGLEDSDQRLLWLDIHRAIGLGILVLVVVRLLVRLTFGRDRPVDRTFPLWMKAGSHLSHFALYLLMAALPLLGWALSSAKARHFKLFGEQLPSLVHKNADLADQLGEWHELLGWTLAAVIGAHLLAALYHHFVRRDSVLSSML